VLNLNLSINTKTLLIMLMRRSRSLSFITSEAIKSLVDTIQKENGETMRSKNRPPQENKQVAKPAEIAEKPIRSNMGDKHINMIFVKIAEHLFNRNLTVLQVINEKVYDKMINGREFQLINATSFFHLFSVEGLDFDENEKRVIINLLKITFMIDVIDADKFIKIMEALDIKEDIPKSTGTMDYHQLVAADIRMVNAIIEHMDSNDIENFEDFIGKDKIKEIEVVSKDNVKSNVKVINTNELSNLMFELELIEDDEISEGLNMFFALSMDNLGLLQIRKIKK